MTSDCGGVTSIHNGQIYTLRHKTDFVASTVYENSWVKVLKENCTEFVDSCGAIPERNNLLTSITIPLNFYVSVEIRTKAFTLSKDLNIFYMINNEWNSSNKGKRLFAMWLDHISSDGVTVNEDFWVRKWIDIYREAFFY